MLSKRTFFAVGLLSVLAILALSTSRTAKAAGDDSGIGEKWAAAWNSHDPDKMLPLFTDDISYEDVAYSAVSHNHAELRKFAAEEFESIPDLNLKVERSVFHNGHGTVEWAFSGTDKGVYKTGKKFTVRGVSVVDVRDGKISRCLDYYDTGTIMRQLGQLPEGK